MLKYPLGLYKNKLGLLCTVMYLQAMTFKKYKMTVLLILTFSQKRNRPYNKENDIPIMLLKMHQHGNCTIETKDDENEHFYVKMLLLIKNVIEFL